MTHAADQQTTVTTPPIRIAVAGVGKIARDQHLPSIAANPGFQLAATIELGDGIAGVPNFTSVAEMVASDAAVSAIAICTPPQVRGELARAALAAGLAVMLEKPPAASLAEFAELRAGAAAAGLTLFATWHSRHACQVAAAKAWLLGKRITEGSIVWREDVRRWHPGQRWLWEAGGLGVFDPGINALSILTDILPSQPRVTSAALHVPENCETPIAVQMHLAIGGGAIAVDFDFRQQGPQTWDIALRTDCGGEMRLHDGGARLILDGVEQAQRPNAEYASIYHHFAELIATGSSDADDSPLRLVADALVIGERHSAPPFYD